MYRYSWKDSDAIEIISKFCGNVTVIGAEVDDVIPSKIREQLYDSATKAKNRILQIVPNSKYESLFPKEKDFLVVMNILRVVLTDGKVNSRNILPGINLDW